MNINYKQPQFELFPPNTATMEDVNKPRFLLANLTLSMESLVILAILGIMIALFSFSIGVERGKRITAQAMDERVAVAWNLGSRKPAPMVKNIPLPAAAMEQAAAAVVVARPTGKPMTVVASKPVVTKSVQVKHAVAAQKLPATLVMQKPVASQRWTVQLATYGNLAYAQQEAVNLRRLGWPTFLIQKGKFYLICGGQFTSQDEAQKFQRKASSKYSATQIRRF